MVPNDAHDRMPPRLGLNVPHGPSGAHTAQFLREVGRAWSEPRQSTLGHDKCQGDAHGVHQRERKD
jgi:hypothetical protein